MARRQERERPVSEKEFEEMPERISDHFDRIRDRLESEIEDE